MQTLVKSPTATELASQLAEQMDPTGAGRALDGEQVQAPLAIRGVGGAVHTTASERSATMAGQHIRSSRNQQ
jgi:hypothetical protein